MLIVCIFFKWHNNTNKLGSNKNLTISTKLVCNKSTKTILSDGAYCTHEVNCHFIRANGIIKDNALKKLYQLILYITKCCFIVPTTGKKKTKQRTLPITSAWIVTNTCLFVFQNEFLVAVPGLKDSLKTKSLSPAKSTENKPPLLGASK